MHVFHYVQQELFCEQVPVRKIAEAVGTPCYLYSQQSLLEQFRSFDQAFADLPHLLCFAMKANSNLAVLKTFANEGAGVDIVSGGELYRALRAGIDPKKMVFAGVGKSEEEIGYALESGILLFNVESMPELLTINRLAGERRVKAPVALRVNPDVDPQTHPYIATGLKKSKFGIAITEALREYTLAASLPNLEIIGVHQHIGSQLLEVAPLADAVGKVVQLIGQLREQGMAIRYFDVGGGLGIRYQDETPPAPAQLAAVLTPILQRSGCTCIFEPGRFMVGNAGLLVTRLLYRKRTEEKEFFIVDAAMNDLARPSLYGSYHAILPLVRRDAGGDGPAVDGGAEVAGVAPEVVADVVGPVCESGDFLAKERPLPDCKAGELLAVMSAGAYGFAMSSNYNSRPRAAEVLVRGKEFYVVRRRETYEDLIRGEVIPDCLQG